LEGCGFESHPRLHGYGVTAMPRSISAPNHGSFNNYKEKKKVAKWGTPKKAISNCQIKLGLSKSSLIHTVE